MTATPLLGKLAATNSGHISPVYAPRVDGNRICGSGAGYGKITKARPFRTCSLSQVE